MLALRAALEERAARPSAAPRGLPRIRGPRPPRAQGRPARASRRFRSTRTRSSSTRPTSRPSNWTADELADALVGLEAIDRGVKSGAGTGPELLEAWLLSRLPSRRRAFWRATRAKIVPPVSEPSGDPRVRFDRRDGVFVARRASP